MPNVKSVSLASLLTVALLGSCAEESGDDDGLLVANVNIVDVAKKQIDSKKNILIRDGRIVRIVDEEEAAAYRDRYDARGAFATAGLYDAHVHIDTAGRLELMLPEIFGEQISDSDIDDDVAAYMAYGVTGIVVLGGDEEILAARERAKAHGAFLPRIIAASPILDGPEAGNPTHEKIAGEGEAGAAVDGAAAAGYDLIKIYSGLDAETRNAVIKRAGELGTPVAGHLSPAMTLEEAIVPGLSNVAHAEEITRTWDGEDKTYLTHSVSLMAQHKVSLTPNLVAYREIADQIRNIDQTLARKDWALAPPVARVYATPPFNGYVNDFGGDEIRERAIAHFTRTAKAMDGLTLEAHEAGVMILAGSDVGNPTMFAGQALYREIELLKDAGLDGYDALAAATLNVAKLFGEESERGSVAAGKVADLVLFRVNPVDDGSLTRSDVAAVIKDGVLFDQERIAAETSRLSAAFEERAARYYEMAMTNHTREEK